MLWFNWHRFGSPFTFVVPTAIGGPADLAAPWFSAQHALGMLGLTVSPGKGLLWYTPPTIAVLALGRALHRRARAEVIALAAWTVAAVIFIGHFAFWHGEWGWGPRYLAPTALATAPLCWVAADWLQRHPRHARAVAAAAVFAIAVQALPVISYPIEWHFETTLPRLAAAGALVTSPITHPPLPADNGVLYFEPANSMIATVARTAGHALASHQVGLLGRLARALLVPLAASILVRRAARITAAPPAPAR